MPDSITKSLFSDADEAFGTVEETPTASSSAKESASDEQSRGDKMRATRDRKMKELFEGKQYAILGEIHLSEDEQFQTPFGNKGRNGYVIKEVNSGNRLMVGETVLRKAHEKYGSVPGLPPQKEKRFRRTKAQKQADDARKAAQRAETQDRILARFEKEIETKDKSN